MCALDPKRCASMTCFMCRSTGFITVRTTDRIGQGTAKYVSDKRPCLMGCQVSVNGVGPGRLAGNEMSYADLVALLSEDQPEEDQPPSDYKAAKRGHDIGKYYGFKT
jgi:hypothetical protein